MEILKYLSICAVTALTCAAMVFTALACDIPCDCPKCAYDAFTSAQEDVYSYTLKIAEEYSVDKYILFAIMYRESRFQSDAINYNSNSTIDRGICQINSVNKHWLADEGIDISTTYGNIEAAARILSIFMEDYTEREAIAAYGVGCSGMLAGEGFDQANDLYLIVDELKNV